MIGETLGSYRILSEIGSGGMGVVYKAEHLVLGRKAAVKLLRGDVSEELVQRFFNEAKAAATLQHPGLVDVFDFGHHSSGRAFIVMEFLQGESLAERLDHEPRLSVPIACFIARSVANALEIAHNEGIVHRDLKPGNIFLVPDVETPAGVRTKVLDFGIAKLVRQREVPEGRGVNTQSGAVIGTPRYMSPEQCKNAKSVDGRSDIYSLGCILYEMLLGVAPFDYDSWAELVGAHIYEIPPKPSEIDAKLPPTVETLVCKMLEKAPEDRFNSMKELAESLEVLLREQGAAPVRLTPPGRMSTPPHGMRKPATGDGADPTLPAGISHERKAVATAPTMSSTGEKAAGERAPITTSPPPRKLPWVAIGIAGAGIAALAVAGTLVLGKDTSKPAEEPTYVVVEHGSADQPIAHVEEPAVALDAAPAAIPAPAIDAGTATVAKTPTEVDVGQLTRTFGRQNAAITTCFKQHPTTVEGQISVRFQIDTSGKVKTADVLPASIASSALGTCIADVAKRTNFGPQPHAVAFKAPLVTLEN